MDITCPLTLNEPAAFTFPSRMVLQMLAISAFAVVLISAEVSRLFLSWGVFGGNRVSRFMTSGAIVRPVGCICSSVCRWT